MVISSRFQSTTDCPERDVKAIADRGTSSGRAVAASAGALVPATTAAMAATIRALPVLRMLCVPLDWVRPTASAGSNPRPCRPGSATNTFSTCRVFTTDRLPRSPGTRQPAHVSPERLDGGNSGRPPACSRSARRWVPGCRSPAAESSGADRPRRCTRRGGAATQLINGSRPGHHGLVQTRPRSRSPRGSPAHDEGTSGAVSRRPARRPGAR